MQYKVEYVSECGTPSDNEWIGIYDNSVDAIWAKEEYIGDRCGYTSKLDFTTKNPNATKDELEDFVDEFTYLDRQVWIEKVNNLYSR